MTFSMPSAILALLGLLPRWLALRARSTKEALEILPLARLARESSLPDTSQFRSLTPVDLNWP